jgi:hypothetical protein
MGIYKNGPEEKIWHSVLTSVSDITKITKAGKVCILFRDNFLNDYCSSRGFLADFAGYQCYALNFYAFGSQAFRDNFFKHKICISFVLTGKKWTVGLYSQKIDVSKIAQEYGGGGHKGAAGFTCETLPFEVSGKKAFKPKYPNNNFKKGNKASGKYWPKAKTK